MPNLPPIISASQRRWAARCTLLAQLGALASVVALLGHALAEGDRRRISAWFVVLLLLSQCVVLARAFLLWRPAYLAMASMGVALCVLALVLSATLPDGRHTAET